MTDRGAGDPRIPVSSLIFGFGPMLPLVVAGIAVWTMGAGWPRLAVQLAIVWGAIILAFVGGVRRGFGFGRARAATIGEIVESGVYLALGGVALTVAFASTALAVLVVGYVLAALLDARAARRGDAPAHFARLRPPQLLLGAAGLAATWAWVVH